MVAAMVTPGRDGAPPWLAPTSSPCPLLPAPDPVTITCTSTSGGYGLVLTWTCPPGGYQAFELQVGGQRDHKDRASCEKGVTVSDLQPAQSYAAIVWTLWDGLRAPAVSVTCHTESAGERSPGGGQSLQTPQNLWWWWGSYLPRGP